MKRTKGTPKVTTLNTLHLQHSFFHTLATFLLIAFKSSVRIRTTKKRKGWSTLKSLFKKYCVNNCVKYCVNKAKAHFYIVIYLYTYRETSPALASILLLYKTQPISFKLPLRFKGLNWIPSIYYLTRPQVCHVPSQLWGGKPPHSFRRAL